LMRLWIGVEKCLGLSALGLVWKVFWLYTVVRAFSEVEFADNIPR
jgi:hypothetical protein